VAVGLELVQGAAERAHAQVEAVPVLDQVEAQRRTRSATAARPRGLALVPRAADLAAMVVEIMPEPAATGEAVAWAAAG